jgi:hypothetical protein
MRLIIDQFEERRDIDDLETERADPVAEPPPRTGIDVKARWRSSFAARRSSGLGAAASEDCSVRVRVSDRRRPRCAEGTSSMACRPSPISAGRHRRINVGEALRPRRMSGAGLARSASAMASAVASSASRIEAWRLR